ncbi:hypothetical protein ACFOHS_14975 [Jhaorihella thermophila]
MKAVQDFPDLSPLGRTTITLAGGMVLMVLVTAVMGTMGSDMLPRGTVGVEQFGLLTIYAVTGMALSQVMWIASVGAAGDCGGLVPHQHRALLRDGDPAVAGGRVGLAAGHRRRDRGAWGRVVAGRGWVGRR